MARGEGPAAGLAVVAIGGRAASAMRIPLPALTADEINAFVESGLADPYQEPEPTQYAVLNQSGAIASGTVPYRAFHTQLGVSPYGKVVLGFGGAANARNVGLRGISQPLYIYVDDQLNYQSNNGWLFGVASDGSSYFSVESAQDDLSIEPQGGLSSRLVIGNLNNGTQGVHDLGAVLEDSDGFLAYQAAYTSSSQEVHLQPISSRSLADGPGLHYFFSASGEGSYRHVQVPDRGRADIAVFRSSEEMYMLYEAENARTHLPILKVRYTWTPHSADSWRVKYETVWTKAGPPGARAYQAKVSENGSRLLVSITDGSTSRAPPGDLGLYVLDTASGETIFHLPTSGAEKQLRYLASVLPPEPTEKDFGRYMGASFADNDRLVVHRQKMKDELLIDWESPIYDVYDMNTLSPDAQPMYRIGSNQHNNPCASKGFPGTLFATEGGKLAYAPLQ